MTQTTHAISGRNCYAALSTDGVNFVDISGFANAVGPDGGERLTGKAYTADTDYSIITSGKRDGITVKVKVVYTEVAVDPYAVVKAAYESATPLYLRWSPAGGDFGNVTFTTAPGFVTTLPYVGVADVANGEALTVEFDILAAYIATGRIPYLDDNKVNLLLGYVSATTISVGAGAVVLNGVPYVFDAGGNLTFADLDTGAEAAGANYYVYAVLSNGVLDFVISASATSPTGYTYYQLIGWFHNNPSSNISPHSVASGTNVLYPERGPRPGMVQYPGLPWMVDIYIASDSGGTGNGIHGGINAAASAYNATPLVSGTAAAQMKACANAGKRLCTNEEWNIAALGTPAGANNNDTCWTAGSNTGSHPTGTLPACVSAIGCYDMTGNVWERVSTWYDLTDVATDQSGWDWATGWTAEAEGGSIYTPFGANTGPDGLPGPRQWIRGGHWLSSTYAGGWAAYGSYSPRLADSAVGFRCCA
jgi:hypothetical protein